MNPSSAGPSSKPRVGPSLPSDSDATFKRNEEYSRKNPHPETVAFVEDIVVEYFTDMDYPKINRCTELLSMNEELKQARKAVEFD
ncbi:hypothetical protein RJ641_030595 [Dillenia turbinata]|uniref:Transcription initiation factor TFIID subunit 13 n=1 Tax=Dillenia turbinata TaxID=194707 RepID=A0AAN8VVP7_9MAGN